MPPKPFRSAAKAVAKATAKQSCLEAILDFLKADDWPHETADDGSAVMTGYGGDNGQFEVAIEVNDEARVVVFHAQLPLEVKTSEEDGVDGEAVAALMEFVLRLNSGLALGCFDLDLGDVSLRFRSGLLLADVPLPADLVRNHLYATVEAADRFFPQLQAVASGDLNCEDAMRQLVGDDESEPEDDADGGDAGKSA